MPLRKAIEDARQKANVHAMRLAGPNFSRKPFEPGTPEHVVKAYEEVERAQLLINIVEKRTATETPTDLDSVLREVDELQASLRCGAIITIF
jgi:hypothetical protein